MNVNSNPHEQPGGGTGFPKLEQNSLEVARASISSRRESQGAEVRRSIIGGDAERAEVMSAVKRVILKRTSYLESAERVPSSNVSQNQTPDHQYRPQVLCQETDLTIDTARRLDRALSVGVLRLEVLRVVNQDAL